MTVHPALVAKVSAAIQHADRGPVEVTYDVLAAAAVEAVCEWVACSLSADRAQR